MSFSVKNFKQLNHPVCYQVLKVTFFIIRVRALFTSISKMFRFVPMRSNPMYSVKNSRLPGVYTKDATDLQPSADLVWQFTGR